MVIDCINRINKHLLFPKFKITYQKKRKSFFPKNAPPKERRNPALFEPAIWAL